MTATIFIPWTSISVEQLKDLVGEDVFKTVIRTTSSTKQKHWYWNGTIPEETLAILKMIEGAKVFRSEDGFTNQKPLTRFLP